ncbi:Predicted N-acetyltransferase YhbS [Alkalibacterium subtropicum]|uniref:Predicted N-acetyltransferase YhbS n=1 Tax=Alkalibacterium subtropicum TaxID=753702 RepID=A0A1I1JSB4_9LACT|nr:GNAT family N-acetyltransferase [Alkalibacterium subtropicum]SFC49418.1 Predicted N-acetyltransferase YhbS [Alkalibacterium subtropicum]
MDNIVHLPKEKWEGTLIPIKYSTNQYFDVSIGHEPRGYRIAIEKKDFLHTVTHSVEEDDQPDRLYADHCEHPFAWGIIDEEKLVAAIETDQENWSNRLRITELWVADDYQKKGVGRALIAIAKEQARHERRRTVILETQSSNVNAIGFYRHQGFDLIGLDTCSYSNDDVERKEVRLEFGWFPADKEKLSRDEIDIRQETEKDHHAVELMTQRAFWNKYKPGCDEHYLVHLLRQDSQYLPELSRIAIKDGQVIGCIMYSKAEVVEGDRSQDVLTFGPLCVDPKWQGMGVGEILLKETMALASEAGYKGIIIFGDPDYYPRLGFEPCDRFEVTTAGGENFDAFMGTELYENSLKDVKGKFHASPVFENIPEEKVEEFSRNFPPLQKRQFPGQWE